MGEIAFLPLKLNQRMKIEFIVLIALLAELEDLKKLPSFPSWRAPKVSSVLIYMRPLPLLFLPFLRRKEHTPRGDD